jgi:hypothetical protein
MVCDLINISKEFRHVSSSVNIKYLLQLGYLVSIVAVALGNYFFQDSRSYVEIRNLQQ